MQYTVDFLSKKNKTKILGDVFFSGSFFLNCRPKLKNVLFYWHLA